MFLRHERAGFYPPQALVRGDIEIIIPQGDVEDRADIVLFQIVEGERVVGKGK